MRRRNVFPFLTGNTNQPAWSGEVVVAAMVNIVQLLNRMAKWLGLGLVMVVVAII